MLTTAELLGLAKDRQGIPSNYRLAKVLDIPINTISRWNTGKTKPDDDMCVRLAELAGLDPGQVVASIRAERCEPGPMRDVWAGVAERLARVGVAAAMAAVTVLGVTVSPDAGAMALAGTHHAAASRAPIPYVKLSKSRRRWWLRLVDLVLPFIPNRVDKYWSLA